MRRAIVIFTRDASQDRKRFGLGRYADVRLAASLVEHARRTAERCADIADVIVADDRWQSGVTFEERLLSALRLVRRHGAYDRIVLVGTDTPGLSARDLRAALLGTDAVVGPSADGGFYLLGLDASELEPTLRGLPWCTSEVGRALEARLGQVVRLRQRRDLDDARDTRALLRVLRALLGPLDNQPAAGRPDRADRVQARRAEASATPTRGPPRLG